MKTRTCALASAMLVAVSSSTGCYTTWDIPHHELQKLDGYHAPAHAKLRDTEGSSVELDPDAQLWLRLQHHYGWIKTEAAAAYANGPVLTVLPTTGEGPLRIDLREVGSAKVKRFSAGKTTALVVGVVLGTAATVAGIAVGLVALSHAHYGGFGGFGSFGGVGGD